MTRALTPALVGSSTRRSGDPVLHAVTRALGRLRLAAPHRPRWLRGPRLDTPVVAPTLQTDRLLLRPHRMSDAAAWYALQCEPTVLEFLPWPERTRRQSARHLAHRTRHTRLLQRDDFLALGVERDGILIGDVSLHLRDVGAGERSAEIGWILAPAWEGRGYATEASNAMLDLAFGRLGAKWVTAVVDAGNTRSIALAERLGFLPVGDDGSDRVLRLGADQFRRATH